MEPSKSYLEQKNSPLKCSISKKSDLFSQASQSRKVVVQRDRLKSVLFERQLTQVQVHYPDYLADSPDYLADSSDYLADSLENWTDPTPALSLENAKLDSANGQSL